MGKVMLATGLIVVYSYAMEAYFGWYSASKYEYFMVTNRIWNGPYWFMYWFLLFCNVLSIQFLWFKRFRESPFWLFIISIIVSIGMWLERFVIIVTSLQRDFLPSSWAMYAPIDLGLVAVYWHDRILLYACIPVRQVPAR